MPEGKRLLEAEIVQVSPEHPTLGYKKVAAKLRSLGYRANKKMVQRVRREEGLQAPLAALASGGRGCLRDCRRRLSAATTSGPGTSFQTTPSEGASCGPSI